MIPTASVNGPADRSSRSAVAVPHQRRPLLRMAALFALILGVLLSSICLAADNGIELYPGWVRPGPDTLLRVKLPTSVDTRQKLFLRLTQANSAIAVFPVSVEQLRSRVAEVKVTGPLRRGRYQADLVNEAGMLLAPGAKGILIGAAEKPVITGIRPKVVYPKKGRYDFEIIGDNFNHIDEESLVIRINDVALSGLKRCSADATASPSSPGSSRALPCLISDWRSIRVNGLTLDNVEIGRPLEVSVEIDRLVSEPAPLVLSLVQRYTPRVIAVLSLAVVALLVYLLFIRRGAHGTRRYCAMAYLFIDPQTNTYSLSKLQMVIWAGAAIVAYSYLAASQFLVQWKLGIPSVPTGLPMLLGISATTTALAVGATEFRGSKGAGLVNPGLADFITIGGVFAPERLQFFVWTVLGALTFVAATLAQDPGTATEMAAIPDTFNQLMGASSLGYLAGKFARKPGPVIKGVTVDGTTGEVRIAGDNLSPRSQVTLDGMSVTDRMSIAPGQTDGAEFVSQLIVKPEAAGAGEVVQVMIRNPDGQSAEWTAVTRPACGTSPAAVSP